MSEAVKVDVWSDVQCPWCYIGKRKFEDGAAQFGGGVEVEYHSFELAPDTPVDYEGTTLEYLSERKGMPVAQVKEMLERVTGIASSVGLDFDYEHVHQTNTVKAHELIHFAKSKGCQLDVKERLLKAYFVEGHHVGHIDDLADLAAEIGLDRAEVVTRSRSGDVPRRCEGRRRSSGGVRHPGCAVLCDRWQVRRLRGAGCRYLHRSTTAGACRARPGTRRRCGEVSTGTVSPFVLVGDPSAAACEGDFCPVPEVRERVAVPEDQEQTLSPVVKAPAPAAGF